MPAGAFQEWCEADTCPAAVCGGPHEIWRNPDTHQLMTLKAGQPHPVHGYTEKVTGAVADRPSKDADPAEIAKAMDRLRARHETKIQRRPLAGQLRYLAAQLRAGTGAATVALAIEIISTEVAETEKALQPARCRHCQARIVPQGPCPDWADPAATKFPVLFCPGRGESFPVHEPYLAARPDTAAALVHDALFLRMNGERPAGAPQDPAGETWADWDRRAEAFLRGVPPA